MEFYIHYNYHIPKLGKNGENFLSMGLSANEKNAITPKIPKIPQANLLSESPHPSTSAGRLLLKPRIWLDFKKLFWLCAGTIKLWLEFHRVSNSSVLVLALNFSNWKTLLNEKTVMVGLENPRSADFHKYIYFFNVTASGGLYSSINITVYSPN